jgi:LysR family transcriptional regulator, regulator of abg operon
MKLNQLRDMVAIVERGSLRAAARHLELAQPALTRSIRTLEHELGTTLFEREARGMVLTPMGKLFYRRASSVVNDLRRAREELEQTSGDMQGTVVAGLSIMPHVGMLPSALPAFRKKFPQIKLKIIEGLYPAIEAGLRDGSIDFYLGASPQTNPAPGLVTEVLFENTRTIVGRKNHPLSGAKSIKELGQAEWATTSVNYNAAEDLDELFAKYKMPAPKVMLQAHSAMSVMVALAYSDLLAILPVQWNEFPLTRGALHVINIRERLPAPSIVCIRRPDLPLTPAAEFFCDLLRRYSVLETTAFSR